MKKLNEMTLLVLGTFVFLSHVVDPYVIDASAELQHLNRVQTDTEPLAIDIQKKWEQLRDVEVDVVSDVKQIQDNLKKTGSTAAEAEKYYEVLAERHENHDKQKQSETLDEFENQSYRESGYTTYSYVTKNATGTDFDQAGSDRTPVDDKFQQMVNGYNKMMKSFTQNALTYTELSRNITTFHKNSVNYGEQARVLNTKYFATHQSSDFHNLDLIQKLFWKEMEKLQAAEADKDKLRTDMLADINDFKKSAASFNEWFNGWDEKLNKNKAAEPS